jgi:hypothetical protein
MPTRKNTTKQRFHSTREQAEPLSFHPAEGWGPGAALDADGSQSIPGVETPRMPPLAELKKTELASHFEDIAYRSLGLLGPEKLLDCSAKELVTVAGLAAEKMLVLRGKTNQAAYPELTQEERRRRLMEIFAGAEGESREDKPA